LLIISAYLYVGTRGIQERRYWLDNHHIWRQQTSLGELVTNHVISHFYSPKKWTCQLCIQISCKLCKFQLTTPKADTFQKDFYLIFLCGSWCKLKRTTASTVDKHERAFNSFFMDLCFILNWAMVNFYILRTCFWRSQ